MSAKFVEAFNQCKSSYMNQNVDAYLYVRIRNDLELLGINDAIIGVYVDEKGVRHTTVESDQCGCGVIINKNNFLFFTK